MTDKKETLVKAGFAVAVLVVVYLLLRRHTTGNVVNQGDVILEGNKYDPFEWPYLQPNPGVSFPGKGPTFNTGDIAVNVGTIGANGLSNQYMPVFGLVGMTAVKG